MYTPPAVDLDCKPAIDGTVAPASHLAPDVTEEDGETTPFQRLRRLFAGER